MRLLRGVIMAILATGGLVGSSMSVVPVPASAGVLADAHHHGGAGGAGQGGAARSSQYPPIIRRTNRPPTGYTVTFRYWDPVATSVQIKGEWYFANPTELTQTASTATSTVATPGLLPSQWQPGDFPIDYPNAVAANWPVANMTLNPVTGVWSYTTPLPSGVFTYGFFVNCFSSTQSGCTEVSDPSNPPWNQQDGLTIGSVEPTSQVYMPSDAKFDTVNYWWQAPNRERGTLTDVTYPSPTHVSPPGQNYLAIYTPPGYNSARPTPYPTLYISHGGGGNEVDWTTQGDLGNILDNLIDTGQVQPMVVVMTNFNGFTDDCAALAWDQEYSQDLINSVIPYVQAHYDVSDQPAERAFSGLSCGGFLTSYLLLNNTSEFGYYGEMSGAFATALSGGPTTLTSAQVSALQKVGIFMGGGWQDPIHYLQLSEVNSLQAAGVGVTPDFINGGHEWYVWRILLKDFLTRVAFWPVVNP
jgi:enterochelin esterase-like enzyme